MLENTKIEAGKFYLLAGFFWLRYAIRGDRTEETAEVILNIEQAEFETDQIAETGDFLPGTLIYWDEGMSIHRRSQRQPSCWSRDRRKGENDENDVIRFILGSQVYPVIEAEGIEAEGERGEESVRTYSQDTLKRGPHKAPTQKRCHLSWMGTL